jgi:hypothetical protein
VGCPLILSIDIPDTATRFRGKAVVRWSQSVEKQGREATWQAWRSWRSRSARGERLGFFAGGTKNLLPADTRQKHRRVMANEADVTCTVSGFMGAFGLSGNIAKSLVDVSEGGCKLVLEKKVEVGSKVKLQFTFKHRPSRSAPRGSSSAATATRFGWNRSTTPASSSRTCRTGTPPTSRIVLKALSE